MDALPGDSDKTPDETWVMFSAEEKEELIRHWHQFNPQDKSKKNFVEAVGVGFGDLPTCAPEAVVKIYSAFVSNFTELTTIQLISRGFRDTNRPHIRLMLTDGIKGKAKEIPRKFAPCTESGGVRIILDCEGLAHRFLADIPPCVASRVTHLSMACIEGIGDNGNPVPYFHEKFVSVVVDNSAHRLSSEDSNLSVTDNPARLYFSKNSSPSTVDPDLGYVEHGVGFTSLIYLHIHHRGRGHYGNNCIQLCSASTAFMINAASRLDELEIDDEGFFRMNALRALRRMGQRLKRLRVTNIPYWGVFSLGDPYPPEDKQLLIRSAIDELCTNLTCPATIETWWKKDSRFYKAALAARAAAGAGAERVTVEQAIEAAVGRYSFGTLSYPNGEPPAPDPQVAIAALAAARAAVAAEFPF